MKRVLSLVIALSMVLSMFTFAFAAPLKDVAGTGFEAAVSALVELGVVAGYTDGTYLPEKVVTRAEMAKLLVVAAGLEPAAKVAVGATRFADVAADHWATGYINVAAEYGYIAGYPDGTFLPDQTVSYAEAVTMALRVLGYKSVVEAKGTWPTNYISKAQDLEMLEDISYGTYTEGAKRGNVALLIWNMLTTEMWDIKSESEGDGLTSGYSGKEMLEVKFPDYEYLDEEDEVVFDVFEIDEGNVLVTLSGDTKFTDYEYFKNDFYTFVPGQRVEALVNTKDETVLMMVPTGEDKLVQGSKMDLNEDYKALSGDVFHYAYGLVERREIVKATKIIAESSYIYEINTSNKSRIKFENADFISLLGSNNYIDYDDAEDELFLKNGERVSVKDIEVGDVVSRVMVCYHLGTKNPDATDEYFYMIVSPKTVEGKLTKFETEDDENSKLDDEYEVATIGGERYYTQPNAIYFVDAEDEDPEGDFVTDRDNKMKNEVVEAKLDFLGTIAAVIFDGKIDGGDADEGDVRFYAFTDDVDGTTIAVENEDGEETLTFARRSTARSWEKLDLKGRFAILTLDDDGEITDSGDLTEPAIPFMLRQDNSGDVSSLLKTLKYGDGTNESYNVSGEKVSFEKTTNTIQGKKVNSSTVLVKLLFDDKGTTRTKDDEFRVEFFEDAVAEIEKIKNEPVVVITDNANNFARAKYVVVFDEVSNREDDLVGIVVDAFKDGLSDKMRVAVADTRLERAKDIREARDNALLYIGGPSGDQSGDVKKFQVVVYSSEENKNGEMEMTIVASLSGDQLNLDTEDSAYIAKGTSTNKKVSDDGREAKVTDGTPSISSHLSAAGVLDLDDEDVEDELEDYMVVVVNVEVDEDDANEKQYNAESFDVVDYADLKLKELDRIVIDKTAEVIFIIRGMD